MLTGDDPRPGRHFVKNGALSSDPLTCVRSGWYEKDGRGIVYVVMAVQPGSAGRPPAEAYRRLAETAKTLTEAVLREARGAAP